MGYGSYSDEFYADRVATRAKTGKATFDHDSDIRTGKVRAGVHDSLNVHGRIRESRDSDQHPRSKAIAVFLDQTGSMASLPPKIQAELPKLMGLLLKRDFCQDPQILFGAVGDFWNGEKAPLQVGQFESGIEMDDNLTKIFLEGGGGGSNQESYQNALYFLAHRTSCDCFEKRGEKGYAFIIGDEAAYDVATKRELSELLGVTVEADVPTDQIMKDCLERWEVFFIIPRGSSNFDNKTITNWWTKHIGAERIIRLEDVTAICETIGTTIGLLEGATDTDTIATDLKAVGATDAIVRATQASVGALARTGGTATGDVPARAVTIERF